MEKRMIKYISYLVLGGSLISFAFARGPRWQTYGGGGPGGFGGGYNYYNNFYPNTNFPYNLPQRPRYRYLYNQTPNYYNYNYNYQYLSPGPHGKGRGQFNNPPRYYRRYNYTNCPRYQYNYTRNYNYLGPGPHGNGPGRGYRYNYMNGTNMYRYQNQYPGPYGRGYINRQQTPNYRLYRYRYYNYNQTQINP